MEKRGERRKKREKRGERGKRGKMWRNWGKMGHRKEKGKFKEREGRNKRKRLFINIGDYNK